MAASGERAFDDFARRRLPALLHTAHLLTGDRWMAEDLVQTALARSYAAWGRICHEDPEGYVRVVLLNAYRSWWRRRPWREVAAGDDLPEAATSPGGNVEQRHVDRDQVWAALGTLSRQQRAFVVLRYYEDLPDLEIARLLGCGVGTVKKRAARALARL